jgi:hypothetical protein
MQILEMDKPIRETLGKMDYSSGVHQQEWTGPNFNLCSEYTSKNGLIQLGIYFSRVWKQDSVYMWGDVGVRGVEG